MVCKVFKVKACQVSCIMEETICRRCHIAIWKAVAYSVPLTTEKVAQGEDNCCTTGVSKGDRKYVWMWERTVL